MGKKFTCISCGEEKWWQLVGIHEGISNALCQSCTDGGKTLNTEVAKIYRCVLCKRAYKENPGLCPHCKQRTYKDAPTSLDEKEKVQQEYQRKQKEERLKLRSKMKDLQNNVCAICLSPSPSFIDHDHKTGYIRGLLCPSCNTALGFLKDDTDNLLRAVEYLKNPPMKEQITY